MMNMTKLIPVMVYADIRRAHDFLVEVFGFDAGGVQCDGTGRPVHGEVTAGDTTIWLHAISPDHRMDKSDRHFGARTSCYARTGPWKCSTWRRRSKPISVGSDANIL